MLDFCGQLAPKEKGEKVLALQINSFPKFIYQEAYCFHEWNQDLETGIFLESLPLGKVN